MRKLENIYIFLFLICLLSSFLCALLTICTHYLVHNLSLQILLAQENQHFESCLCLSVLPPPQGWILEPSRIEDFDYNDQLLFSR